jgi:hypothetical protein
LLRAAALLLGLVAPPLLAALPAVPLELPGPIAFPQYLDTVKVSEAIMTAFTNKKWLIEADTGEAVRAHLAIRRHVLRIRIDYSTRGLSYHYLGSELLGYEEDAGEKYIHPNANKWLSQLAAEVQIQIQRLYFERTPAEVVPVEPPPHPAPNQ